MDRKKRNSFVFIIPVRNPGDTKVRDYQCIEAALRETVRSLTQQTWENIHVIVVCHTVPLWSSEYGDRVTFLNVKNSPVFPPNTNPVRVDKGLKYILGILYAKNILDPALIMPMDADDYVNVNLAKELIWKNKFNLLSDGYVVRQGLHVNLEITSEYLIKYENAYQIRNFNYSCGSCRIFKINPLLKKLKSIDSNIIEEFTCWPPKSSDFSLDVPKEPVVWLSDHSRSSYLDEDSIVNILGRHINQKPYFKLSPLSLIGAAKGCGHGNHDGPRQGEIHQDKLIDSFPIQQFYDEFGLLERN
ncbi:MAG: glycosyltransferase family 2 protein [Leptolyngbya sp. SIO1D8]|nr:glycosyltransferase family 2 protein [Leptolyngbya sp. SIO1D8]